VTLEIHGRVRLERLGHRDDGRDVKHHLDEISRRVLLEELAGHLVPHLALDTLRRHVGGDHELRHERGHRPGLDYEIVLGYEVFPGLEEELAERRLDLLVN
jgi:hypothetical protein